MRNVRSAADLQDIRPDGTMGKEINDQKDNTKKRKENAEENTGKTTGGAMLDGSFGEALDGGDGCAEAHHGGDGIGTEGDMLHKHADKRDVIQERKNKNAQEIDNEEHNSVNEEEQEGKANGFQKLGLLGHGGTS